jgi:hypothetical protein
MKEKAKPRRQGLDIFETVMGFEIDRFQRKEGREIKPFTVREILDEEIAGR